MTGAMRPRERSELVRWREASRRAVDSTRDSAALFTEYLAAGGPDAIKSLQATVRKLQAQQEELKADRRLERFRKLQKDLEEADAVAATLRQLAYSQGVSEEEMDAHIAKKLFKASTLHGASRELLLREIRLLRSQLEEHLVTSRTSRPGGARGAAASGSPGLVPESKLRQARMLQGPHMDAVARLEAAADALDEAEQRYRLPAVSHAEVEADDGSRKQIAVLQQQLSTLAGQKLQLLQQVASLSEQNKALDMKLEAAMDAVSELRRQKTDMLVHAENLSKDLREHLASEAKRADAAEVALAEARLAAAEAREAAEAARARMERAVAEAEAMQAALAEKTAQVDTLRGLYVELRETLEAMASDVTHAQQEAARRVLDANREMFADQRALLEDVQHKATGARAAAQQGAEAVADLSAEQRALVTEVGAYKDERRAFERQLAATQQLLAQSEDARVRLARQAIAASALARIEDKRHARTVQLLLHEVPQQVAQRLGPELQALADGTAAVAEELEHTHATLAEAGVVVSPRGSGAGAPGAPLHAPFVPHLEDDDTSRLLADSRTLRAQLHTLSAGDGLAEPPPPPPGAVAGGGEWYAAPPPPLLHLPQQPYGDGFLPGHPPGMVPIEAMGPQRHQTYVLEPALQPGPQQHMLPLPLAPYGIVPQQQQLQPQQPHHMELVLEVAPPVSYGRGGPYGGSRLAATPPRRAWPPSPPPGWSFADGSSPPLPPVAPVRSWEEAAPAPAPLLPHAPAAPHASWEELAPATVLDSLDRGPGGHAAGPAPPPQLPPGPAPAAAAHDARGAGLPAAVRDAAAAEYAQPRAAEAAPPRQGEDAAARDQLPRKPATPATAPSPAPSRAASARGAPAGARPPSRQLSVRSAAGAGGAPQAGQHVPADVWVPSRALLEAMPNAVSGSSTPAAGGGGALPAAAAGAARGVAAQGAGTEAERNVGAAAAAAAAAAEPAGAGAQAQEPQQQQQQQQQRSDALPGAVSAAAGGARTTPGDAADGSAAATARDAAGTGAGAAAVAHTQPPHEAAPQPSWGAAGGDAALDEASDVEEAAVGHGVVPPVPPRQVSTPGAQAPAEAAVAARSASSARLAHGPGAAGTASAAAASPPPAALEPRLPSGSAQQAATSNAMHVQGGSGAAFASGGHVLAAHTPQGQAVVSGTGAAAKAGAVRVQDSGVATVLDGGRAWAEYTQGQAVASGGGVITPTRAAAHVQDNRIMEATSLGDGRVLVGQPLSQVGVSSTAVQADAQRTPGVPRGGLSAHVWVPSPALLDAYKRKQVE